MINGLSKHTQNAGSAVAYFLDDKYFQIDTEVDLDGYDPTEKRGEWKPREPRPVLLEGDPAQMTALCESLSFKNRYTSGVLSFSPQETAKIAATPGLKEQLIEELRSFAYAGVKNDECKPLLVVQHEHTGRLELHYLIPRVSLESGKYFNPFPPNYNGKRGRGADADYRVQNDAFTDYVCSKYNLQNPRDPEFARDIKIHRFDPHRVIKETINEQVKHMVERGAIKSRDDIIGYLEKAGGTITRKGDDYLSVKFDENKRAIRLKGPMYGKESFAEIKHRYDTAVAGRSAEAEGVDRRYAEVLSKRSDEVGKRHSLKGQAAERAEDLDQKSALELGEYAEELRALKDSLPDAGFYSRGVSDSFANDPALATGDFGGIEPGVAESGSGVPPILTGDPILDQMIRAFDKMQKKLANEALQRGKALWKTDPQQEKLMREISDLMTKLFAGLTAGKNFISGGSDAMTPHDIAMARQMIQEQHRELQRELRAVAQVVRQKERTEPLREILGTGKPADPTQREPARLSAQLAKLVDKHAVLKPAQDIDDFGGSKRLRSNWLNDKVGAVRSDAGFWDIPHDVAQIERGVVNAMARHKVPAMQAYDAVLKESAVSLGDARHAAEIVAQEYTRIALAKEGKPEVNLEEEGQRRYSDLYKRAESGIDAELKAMREQSRKEAQVEQQRLDELAEQKRLEQERLRAQRWQSELEMGSDTGPR